MLRSSPEYGDYMTDDPIAAIVQRNGGRVAGLLATMRETI
jgi:hypothetical protein